MSLLISAVGKGFGVVLSWILKDPCYCLSLLMSGVETKALLRGILSGSVWNGFLLSKVRGENVPCRFCGGVDGDGHLFWDCTFPPLVHTRESPEFSSIVNLDKSNWPRCLLWHGWLPALSGSTFGNPWAEDATRIAKNQLEAALGSYVAAHRHPFDDFRLGECDFDVGDGPFVWSDGSLVVDEVSGVGVAGAGVYAHISGASWFHRRWAHLDLLPPLLHGGGERCRMYCSVPGPLQTVQRAEIWGFWLHSRVRLLYMLEWTI